MSRFAVVVAVLSLLAAPAAALVPEQVPDRIIVASEPLDRGTLQVQEGFGRSPSTKVVDGDAGDWIGTPTRIGGQSIYDAGEHIYSDFLLDAWGADDGGDAQRLQLLDPLSEAEPRTHRVDSLQQAAGDQFGAPSPVGVPDHYGNADAVVANPNLVADLTEVRWAVQDDQALLLVRVNQLVEETDLVVQVNGGAVDGATSAEGFGGVFEAALPVDMLDGPVSVVAGTTADDGTFVPLNAAYRPDEPVTIYNDKLQALSLANGEVPTATIDPDALAAGQTLDWQLGPGYHERQFTSAPEISSETRNEQGRTQPYGLYVPTSYDPSTPTPTTFWLHYRGGKTHSGAAWTPRLITQLGEEHGNLVVTPRGRGTSTWYVTEAHQDFFEVFADVHRLASVDPQRRYVSGYSMGGYGTWLLTTLYPDLFAAGFTQSGAVTQGMWTGMGPDDCPLPCFVEANDGDADAQLTFRALPNLRHVPIAIDHGTDDELVPVTGLERMALELTTLGYRHQFTRFHGYEHYTQAIVDEWADGAAYLNRFTAPLNPRQVTYRVVPQLVEAVNTITADGVAYDFDPDGAYWVDDIVVADEAPFGHLEAVSHAIEEQPTLTVPLVGSASAATVNPGDPVGSIAPTNQTTTFTRTGLDTIADPTATRSVADRLELTLTGVASATIDGSRAGLTPDADVELECDVACEVTVTFDDGSTITALAG